ASCAADTTGCGGVGRPMWSCLCSVELAGPAIRPFHSIAEVRFGAGPCSTAARGAARSCTRRRSPGLHEATHTGYPSMVSVSPAPLLRWGLSPPPDPAEVDRLASALSLPHALAALLVQRDQGSEAAARAYLRPPLDGMSDPTRLAGMAEAVDVITSTVRA